MAALSLRALLVAALAAGSIASPMRKGTCGSSCRQPRQRRAWHTLTDQEKADYIEAEQCLMAKEGSLGLRGGATMYGELQACHVLQSEITHFVGAFLPFHRLLMWAHEELLERECGWTGGQPYWQEQIDAGNFAQSVVLDPVTGFGGDGDPSQGGCIQDGPFVNHTNQVGIGYELEDECITRRINETASFRSRQKNVDDCLVLETWEEAWPCIEALPHSGGHSGVGGQMANPISSPGDPLFYLHHTWLDKIWWDWQVKDLPKRLVEMGGQNRQGGNATGDLPCGGEVIFEPRPDDVPEPVVEGDPGCATTLDHIIHMYGVVEDRTIREVMDIHGDLLCYDYVDPEP